MNVRQWSVWREAKNVDDRKCNRKRELLVSKELKKRTSSFTMCDVSHSSLNVSQKELPTPLIFNFAILHVIDFVFLTCTRGSGQ